MTIDNTVVPHFIAKINELTDEGFDLRHLWFQ